MLKSYTYNKSEVLILKCLFQKEENRLLHDRVKSLEDRLATLENREVSYHMDEDEFNSPKRKQTEAPGSQYGWLVQQKGLKEKG